MPFCYFVGVNKKEEAKSMTSTMSRIRTPKHVWPKKNGLSSGHNPKKLSSWLRIFVTRSTPLMYRISRITVQYALAFKPDSWSPTFILLSSVFLFLGKSRQETSLSRLWSDLCSAVSHFFYSKVIFFSLISFLCNKIIFYLQMIHINAQNFIQSLCLWFDAINSSCEMVR